MTIPLLTVDDERTQFNFDRLAALVTGAAPRIVSGGKKNIAASESTTSTNYTTLTTPDTVTVSLPTDGVLLVGYQAIWQNTVASNARAAIFVGANQLKAAANGAPAVQEATGNSSTNIDQVMGTGPGGLASNTGGSNATEVTTGMVLGPGGNPSGPCWIWADAGTYDISIKFKNSAAGTLSVSKRHLWVAAYAFAS